MSMSDEEVVLDTTDLFTLQKLVSLANRLQESYREQGETDLALRAQIVIGFLEGLAEELSRIALEHVGELTADEGES
ncbi:hypothetical protein E3_0640 [Rhodococcus phage E3]|uniref:hypothetical protein n=1 Tax=Rhodococcus phage E3 TaxID=1007869 RepID=UPI0002C6D7A7|nr:hypothetical protein M176_gp068 [Rhodococcus phage E3]AEQ20978.1 hypothetical protein E3_0640 [Rhodococcus phage E3]